MCPKIPLIAEGAVRGILFAPLVKEGTTGKLEAQRLNEAFLTSIWERRVCQTRAQQIPAAVEASQERFHTPLCGREVEAGHRGLVFDEFLNRIIRRGRVEAVLRAGLVGGEVVLGPWDRIE